MFRDSVCLSQLKKNLYQNVKCVKDGVREVYPDFNCKLTYVALCRKSNVKMFHYRPETEDRYFNCPPGTIIDEKIVNDELSDFYFVSQKSNQGVSQPVHYYLAYDDFKVSRPELYTLIFKLCHLYFNWTGSVKIPAPCQYVKKLSQLIGEKLSERNNLCVVDQRFERELKTLYFL